eukprot:SAG11_NODE_19887_length_457_cov_0.717877_2_plen_114_part_00
MAYKPQVGEMLCVSFAARCIACRKDIKDFCSFRRSVFQHDVLHEGAEVTRGRKYCIRTDVMYGAKVLPPPQLALALRQAATRRAEVAPPPEAEDGGRGSGEEGDEDEEEVDIC